MAIEMPEIEMVLVEGGTFTMGATPEQGDDACDDEKPAHKVTLDSFYIGKFPVTQRLWKAVMGAATRAISRVTICQLRM